MSLSEKTKVGMTVGQLIAVCAFIFSVGGGFAAVGASIDETKSQAMDNKARIEKIERERAAENKEMMILIYEIRESQIRIEGKLELKMDKYTK